MTLKNFIIALKKEFPNADEKTVCSAVNDLEEKLRNEIFSPAGMPVREDFLDLDDDMNAQLILKDSDIIIYWSYVLSLLALMEKDFPLYATYADLFNAKYDQLAVTTRRGFLPITNTPISGRDF